jgi:hypothetical protein
MVGLVVLSGGCTADGGKPAPTQPPDAAGIRVRITPSKSQYSRGEQIVLAVSLTNGTATACRASQVPDGVITLLSLTRDGSPVTPTLVYGRFAEGFANYLTANLVSLAPGASLTVNLVSEDSLVLDDRPGLRISALSVEDEAAIYVWPVGEPGAYTLLARYVLPALPNAPADACRPSTDPAPASFTVTGG